MATATRSRSLQECSSLLIRSRRWHTGRSRGPPAQAEQWASEFEHLPDHRSEITRVWLASKLRMDAFPRTERLIYERTLKRDLDFASQWHAPQPPSSKVVAFASCVAVLGLAGPVYVLLVYATALGQAQSWPFLLNFFFEFMLVYFLIVPLMILFNKIFLPSLLDERLQQDAFEDDEGGGARTQRMRSYPYKTPLNETPLDFLVAREPELKALVDEALKAPSAVPWPRPRARARRGPKALAGSFGADSRPGALEPVVVRVAHAQRVGRLPAAPGHDAGHCHGGAFAHPAGRYLFG